MSVTKRKSEVQDWINRGKGDRVNNNIFRTCVVF